MMHDVRYAIRSLARAKTFTAGAVLTLAIGIGVNATMFSVTSGALLRHMPGIAAPERIAWLSFVSRDGGRQGGLSYPDYLDYRVATASVFADMAGYRLVPISIGNGGVPARLRGAVVSGSFFPMLGVRAAVGRTLAPFDDRQGAPAVAVISARLWRERYAGSPEVLRASVSVNGRSFAVVGVLPREFTGPAIGDTADVWLPMSRWPELRTSESKLLESRNSSWLTVLARLAPGVTVSQAQAVVATIGARLARAYPDVDGNRTAVVSGAGSPVPPGGRSELIPLAALLLAVTAIVLLIACANVANLLLARGAARAQELSIRASLGASRRRLMRQLLTESAILATAAAVAGLLLAFWAADVIVAAAGPDLQGLQTTPDLRIVAFTIALALATVSVFALAPALATTRADVLRGLRATPSAGGRSRLQGTFVVAQLALSLVLLLAAGLSVRALEKSSRLDLGFTPDHLTTASYDLVLQNYTSERRDAFRTDLLSRLRRTPGVQSATIANLAPLSGTVIAGLVTAAGARPGDGTIAYVNAVDPAYFSTMQIPLLRGRAFGDGDVAGAPGATVVNETLARRFWPGGNAIGQRVQVHLKQVRTLEVVGVARDAKYDEATEDPQPFVYLPLAQEPAFDSETLVVRASADLRDVGGLLERTIHGLDAGLPVYDVHPFAAILRERVDKQRALSVLFSCFGAVALLLAAVGLYGVMAYATTRRTHEMGVRLALGATPGQLAASIARDGIRLGLAGTAIGAAGALPLARILGALIFGVQIVDVVVFLGVCALLNAVVLTAALLPARRAARLEPVAALRSE